MRVPISFFIRWTHSNTLVWFSRSLAQCLTHTLSHDLCLSLMLGSRCGSPAWLTLSLLTLAHALPPTRPPGLTVRSVSSLTCGGSPRLALSCSHRATRALVAPSRASPALVLSDVLSASHALFSFQLSRPTLVVSQLKFSQKSSNAHLILLRGRIE